MATELQKQVAAFKKKNVQVQSLQRGLPSIFLNAREAAAVDTSAVYEAGCKGLRDLTSYDERFAAFEGSLFHPTSVNVQRELKTKEVGYLRHYCFLTFFLIEVCFYPGKFLY